MRRPTGAVALTLGLLLVGAPVHAQSTEPDDLPPCPRFEAGEAASQEADEGDAGVAEASSMPPGAGSDVSSDEAAEDCVPLPVEVTQVRQLKSSIWDEAFVEVYNPNRDYGLIRSEYELAWLDKDGGIITVTGQGGLPGAGCCTIYQLPPGGKYIFETLGGIDGRPVAAEIATFGEWHYWPDLEAAGASADGVRLRVKKAAGKDSTATVTGRVAVEQAGPANVIVQAKIGRGPKDTVVMEEVVNCVSGDQQRAFELSYFGRVKKKADIQEIWAYPTTVAGAEGTLQEAPGCN
jgi:hypothetical protein